MIITLYGMIKQLNNGKDKEYGSFPYSFCMVRQSRKMIKVTENNRKGDDRNET